MGETAREYLQWWLPDFPRLEREHPLQRSLVRADRLAEGARGYLGGLHAFFPAPDGLAVAALTREWAAGDAGTACWLRADPAWVQPEMNGARLLACGRMDLSAEEAAMLVQVLAPVFDEAGMTLLATTPDHWHVRLPADMPPPAFASPEQALGEDLFEHLPHGEEGRRWRWLLNEIQVLLHQHPINVARRERGQPPINSLWLWGAGSLPDCVSTALAGVVSDDALVIALARRAGIPALPRDDHHLAAAADGWLIDLQDQSFNTLADGWALFDAQLKRQPVLFAFTSGERWRHRPWHRWRVWRRSRS